jgi:hypothetical protein
LLLRNSPVKIRICANKQFDNIKIVFFSALFLVDLMLAPYANLFFFFFFLTQWVILYMALVVGRSLRSGGEPGQGDRQVPAGVPPLRQTLRLLCNLQVNQKIKINHNKVASWILILIFFDI